MKGLLAALRVTESDCLS